MSPRIEGISQEHLQMEWEKVAEYLTKHVDETDYRNYEAYISRAQLRFAKGDPAIDIVEDLFLAAKCLHGHHKLHLGKIPPARFMTRRLIPLELGLISGQPSMTEEIAIRFGLPFTTLLSNDASYKEFKEASLLSGYISRGQCKNHRDLAGLGALVYAGALSAICRGFDDEAMLALTIFNHARQPFLDKTPPESVKPMLLRYDGLCLSLGLLLEGQYDVLALALKEVIERYDLTLKKKIGETRYLNPDAPHKYFDLSAVAILAMAALRQIEIDLPNEGMTGHYRAFVQVFTTPPERDEEVKPQLDAESRRFLREMGIDPDQIEASMQAQVEAEQGALERASRAAAAEQAMRQRGPLRIPDASSIFQQAVKEDLKGHQNSAEDEKDQ